MKSNCFTLFLSICKDSAQMVWKIQMIRKEEERKKSFQKSHRIETADILEHILLEHIFLCMYSYMDL